MVVIKVSLGEDIRRFSISVLPSFAELRSMLEKLFATNIAGVYDLKYLDSDNDQITVTSDAELVDAIGMAPDQGAGNKLLRLYLVPRGTNPSLLASVVPPKPATTEIDLTPLLQGLGGGNQSTGANPLVSLLSSLLGAQNQQNQQAAPSSGPGCPYLHARPEDGPRVHYFYVCDGCDSKPIVGNLHQCDVCPDFHLCDSCREKGVHSDKNHSFTINPPRRHHGHGHGHGGRWGRRGGHCSPHGSPNKPHGAEPAPAVIVPPTVVPTKPAEPAILVPTIPMKPAVPLVNVPISTPPKVSGIVENVPMAPVVIPSPTIVTPNPHPLVPQVQVPSERFEMSFMSDVTIPDGTEVAAGEAFNKVWRLSNTGPTTWPLGCRLTLDSNTGEKLSSVENIDMPGEVPPGSSVTISVEMEAPKKAGRHVSYWRMRGPSGQPFGPRIWVDIISAEKHIAPSAPVVEDKPAIKPAEQYADQLESLYRMGFMNVDLNRNLLEHNKGNISAVIDQLCTHQR